MNVDKLKPNDPRVRSCTATIRGKTYHYLLAKPQSRHVATILLVHGFPDFSFGWRYQIPMLVSMNLQVIVPDMLGYARTDAPQGLEEYSMKSMSADMAALVAEVAPNEQIILGGHDWGGYLVWRMALWYPDLLRGVFSVCTPFSPPNRTYVDLETLAERLPNFRYQLQLAGPELERMITGKERLAPFLRALYGGRGPKGERLIQTDGVAFAELAKIGQSPLLSSEELDFYVSEISRNGLRGPLNWYRTRKINFDEELELLHRDGGLPKIKPQSMIIMATRDPYLPPMLTARMEKYFEHLTKKTVEAHHWALWEAAADTNTHIREFIERILKGDTVRAAL